MPRLPQLLASGVLTEREALRQFRALQRRAGEHGASVATIAEYFDTLEWAGFDVGAFIREQIGMRNDE